MLRAVDRVLAPLSWLLAAAVVVMLLAGPRVVAKDETQPRTEAAGAAPYAAASATEPGGAPDAPSAEDGKAVFTSNCGTCHTLADAGTSGIAGPQLDDAALDAETVAGIVRGGRGGMPAFGDQLADEDIEAVAAYVAEASGG
jgi:sulfite dehydrogenase